MAKKLDMLNGPLWNRILIFAIPLALTGVLQQLYNTANVMILGRYVSSEAMGAVGNNVPIIGLIISFCMGLALGANVMVARYLGMDDPKKANTAAHTAVAIGIAFGIFSLIVGEIFAGTLLEMMKVPPEVVHHTESYLRVYLLGMPFITTYNFLSAIFRSRGDTQTPLYALCVSSVVNIVASLIAVRMLGLEAGGVAAATVIANFVSATILFIVLCRTNGPLKLNPKRIFRMDPEIRRMIIRIGWPAGLQGMVFSLSNLIIQSAINSLGPQVMAGSVAAFTIEINVYCFIAAFGQATTTFTSQNYGAGNLKRCDRVLWVSLAMNFAATLLMIALVLSFRRPLLEMFTDIQAVVDIGLIRILYVVVPEPVNVVMEVVSDAMRGYGYSLAPAIVTLVSVCTCRIGWVFIAFDRSPTFETLMMGYPVSWVITTILLVILFIHFRTHLRPLPRTAVGRR